MGVAVAGTASYVWVAEPLSGETNQFTVKPVEVQLGNFNSASVEILSGLRAGQQVVVSGNEHLKTGDNVAILEPIPSGLAPATARTPPPMTLSMAGMDHTAADHANEARIEVSSKGFTPARASLQAGIPARLTFIRTDTDNCATEIVVPEYGIRKPLPLKQQVVIEFTPRKGDLAFACGMNMLSGKVLVK
jgi:hypothetical protein